MMSGQRILPRLNEWNRSFWTGGAERELRILQCQDCAAFVHPPQPMCRVCASERVIGRVVSGNGTIATFTINRQSWADGMQVPFVIARVSLCDAPGVILTTNIVGCAVEDIGMGDPVRVIFVQQDDVWLPLFEKVT